MNRKASKAEVESFVTAWVADNVRAAPGGAYEVERLAAGLTGAARAHGISGGDIHRALGDIDDYLAAHYQRACDAEQTGG